MADELSSDLATIDGPEGQIASLREFVTAAAPQNPAALSAEAQRTWIALQGGNSLRPDLAGTALNQLRAPVTYQQKVLKMWEAYATDPMFMRLVNRVVDFVAAGFHWENREDPDTQEGRRRTWPEKIKQRKSNRKEIRLEEEEQLWSAWSEAVNRDTPNTPQGLEFVARWAARHCLLGGMFVPHWRWETFKPRGSKQSYLMPMTVACYPASSVALQRPQALLMEEDIYVRSPSQGQSMSELFTMEAIPIGNAQIPVSSSSMTKLEPIGSQPLAVGVTEAFALKYEWSPGDLQTARLGTMTITGWGQYPNPPFQGLLPQFALRQKLFAGDNAIADGVANYIKIFKVGNEKITLKSTTYNSDGSVREKGTLLEIRDIVEPYLAANAVALYLPWYVELDYKIPNIETLMSEEKYIPSALELLQAFGFFFPRSSAGRNESLEWMNTAGFEQLLVTLQRHIRAFMQRLVRRILEANGSKIKFEPTWTPIPPNTKSAEFRAQMSMLASMGRVSSQTLMEHHNLNADVERRRISTDLATGADDMYDDNVPMNNRQQVVKPRRGGGREEKDRDQTQTPEGSIIKDVQNTNGPQSQGPPQPVMKASRRRKKP